MWLSGRPASEQAAQAAVTEEARAEPLSDTTSVLSVARVRGCRLPRKALSSAPLTSTVVAARFGPGGGTAAPQDTSSSAFELSRREGSERGPTTLARTTLADGCSGALGSAPPSTKRAQPSAAARGSQLTW